MITRVSEQLNTQNNSASIRSLWGTFFYNAKVYDLAGDGTTNDYTKLYNLINTTINGAEATIIFPKGTYKISSNITIPSNISLYFVKGAMLSPDSGVTVTINGPVEAGLWKIFTGSGTIAGGMKVDEVYPEWWGAVRDGTTDDSAEIQSAINLVNSSGGGKVLLSVGTYLIASTLTLYSNVTMEGVFGKSKFNTSLTTGKIISIDTKSNILIQNLVFQAPSNTVLAIELTKSSNIKVKNCIAENITLFSAFNSTAYGSMSESLLSDGIDISDNICTGSGTSVGVSCIVISYCKNVTIKGNKIKTYVHGIQYWGGDANNNINGALANTRWCKDVVIEGNNVTDIGQGGIWGSMGERVTITGNNVSDCGDVCIDVEGTFFAVITGNTAKNGTNGCITTFFFNKGIIVEGNTVYTDVDGQSLFRIYNSAQTQDNKDILVTGNTFHFTGSSGFGLISGDNAEKIIISKNILTNVKISLFSNNNRFLDIKHNVIILSNTAASAFQAIKAGTTNGEGKLNIKDNVIQSTVSVPSGSIGIYALQSDFNSTPLTIIEDNTIQGFDKDIEVLSDSGNAGITPRFIIRNNTLYGTTKFTRTEGATNKSRVVLEGNRDAVLDPYPSSVPAAGKWDASQIIYFNAPVAGGKIGSVCTVAGTPGTWKSFGAIDA